MMMSQKGDITHMSTKTKESVFLAYRAYTIRGDVPLSYVWIIIENKDDRNILGDCIDEITRFNNHDLFHPYYKFAVFLDRGHKG